jgi:hypothetical protein
MDLSEADFAYHATLKLKELPACTVQAAFPGVTDLAVNSRHFTNYVECINSVKGLMDDVVKGVNTSAKRGTKFTVSSEINPAHTGVETRSRDWGPDEIARLWIFDKKQVKSQNIIAVGQARIFAMEKIQPIHSLN